MPELPEVEHAARSLRRWLRGTVVERAWAQPCRVFRGSDPRLLVRLLRGQPLRRLERRGKYLLARFGDDVGLLSHLGMSGKWVRRRPGETVPRHSRARLHLRTGVVLHYDDPRMFGRLLVLPAAELRQLPEIASLGPDALRDGLDPAWLHQRLSRTGRAVKVALMDQRLIAGIGNIQATEALFRAGIHPARAGRTLSRREVGALVRAVDETIAHTLAQMEGRRDDIRYVQERIGEQPFLVYDRAGAPCPRCRRGRIEKMTLGGRTSAYCPRCQR